MIIITSRRNDNCHPNWKRLEVEFSNIGDKGSKKHPGWDRESLHLSNKFSLCLFLCLIVRLWSSIFSTFLNKSFRCWFVLCVMCYVLSILYMCYVLSIIYMCYLIVLSYIFSYIRSFKLSWLQSVLVIWIWKLNCHGEAPMMIEFVNFTFIAS